MNVVRETRRSNSWLLEGLARSFDTFDRPRPCAMPCADPNASIAHDAMFASHWGGARPMHRMSGVTLFVCFGMFSGKCRARARSPTNIGGLPPPLAHNAQTMRHAWSSLLLLLANVQSIDAFANPLNWAFLVRDPLKQELLRRIGVGAPEAEILAAASRLELLNPSAITGAVASALLPGNWLMVYTTSDSIAGKSRPTMLQARQPPEQSIDIADGRACNRESVLGVTNAVDIALLPATRNRVDVKFEKFRLGPLSFPAPEGLTGSLETTYLDDDLRISRGDKDNVFVLLRESTSRETADAVWGGWRASW